MFIFQRSPVAVLAALTVPLLLVLLDRLFDLSAIL